MPASEITATSKLQEAAIALHTWAAQALKVLSTQVWVADDMGFHPRAAVGRPSDDRDRDCARQCCIQGQVVVQGRLLAVPIPLTGQSHGACLFDWPPPHDPTLLSALTGQVEAASAGLDSALHSERLERLSGLARKSDLLRATLTLAHSLEHAAHLRTTMAQLHASLKALMYADNFFVVVLDEDRRHLIFEYAADLFDDREDPIEFHEGRMQGSLSAFVVAAGRLVRGSSLELMQQAGHMDRFKAHQYGPEAHDWLGVPMMAGNEAIGALVVQSYDPAIRFTDADPSILSMVADTVAAALHRRRLREALERTVAERTAQVEQSNQSLQVTVSTLERAMSELVQAEKLASLGSMVAGISHELNTPIGNALTVSST
jgi:GAF domain-containing protein